MNNKIMICLFSVMVMIIAGCKSEVPGVPPEDESSAPVGMAVDAQSQQVPNCYAPGKFVENKNVFKFGDGKVTLGADEGKAIPITIKSSSSLWRSFYLKGAGIVDPATKKKKSWATEEGLKNQLCLSKDADDTGRCKTKTESSFVLPVKMASGFNCINPPGTGISVKAVVYTTPVSDAGKVKWYVQVLELEAAPAPITVSKQCWEETAKCAETQGCRSTLDCQSGLECNPPAPLGALTPAGTTGGVTGTCKKKVIPPDELPPGAPPEEEEVAPVPQGCTQENACKGKNPGDVVTCPTGTATGTICKCKTDCSVEIPQPASQTKLGAACTTDGEKICDKSPDGKAMTLSCAQQSDGKLAYGNSVSCASGQGCIKVSSIITRCVSVGTTQCGKSVCDGVKLKACANTGFFASNLVNSPPPTAKGSYVCDATTGMYVAPA